VAELAGQYQKCKGISLHAFAKAAGVAYWQLRDYLKGSEQRQAKVKTENRLKAQIKPLALKHPTYGYRRVHKETLKKGWQVGEHKVREILKELDVTVIPKAKPRRELPEPTPAAQLPQEPRVQMDATQVTYGGGKAWLYVVEDIASRVCLSIQPVKQLCKLVAASTLKAAQQRLHSQGITDPLVIQTDGGSDFTSEHFQITCKELGSWHRSSIRQTQGMAILERLNKTFKYDFFFRQECDDYDQLQPLSNRFEKWYNRERIHSVIDYLTPWQKLKLDARL
jgi:transposase InsO family protein